MGKTKTEAKQTLNVLIKMWVSHTLETLPLNEREEFIEYSKTKQFKRLMKKNLPDFTAEALRNLAESKEKDNA